MTAVYPPELMQAPLQRGLNIEALDNVIRAETNTGPGLDRAQELADWYQVQCTVVLRSDAERDRFQRWERQDLVRGTQVFDWDAMNRLIGDTETGFFLKMTAKPKFSPRGAAGWYAALELISLPAPPREALVVDGEPQ